MDIIRQADVVGKEKFQISLAEDKLERAFPGMECVSISMVETIVR